MIVSGIASSGEPSGACTVGGTTYPAPVADIPRDEIPEEIDPYEDE